MSDLTQPFETFDHLSTQHIDSLNIDVAHYRHKVTGADHYHLQADDPQNVFFVGLRTVPMDDTGVAHILEHTTLCGSEKYPVRDPFFMMIRRSLNTFMNAFTSSDWTAYPFATENRKDFQNLLQVYMDAVFFPRLHPLDFAQEGWRYEFEEMENPDSDLVYKGVVFNEMKGAMSSPISTLWQRLTQELYPTNTYHYNSGGDPKHIPELSHEQLVDFHQTHYHPSNAVFMTYGDITAAEHQQQFEVLALARFKEQKEKVLVDKEQRYTEPKKVSGVYALDEEETTKKTHIVTAWLLGENKDPKTVLRAHLLSAVLLDNSACPMRQALESTELASAPSPLCGLEDSNREMAFVIGVQGSEAEHTEAVEQLILQTLQKIVQEGVDATLVEAMLHQLELSQREITGDSYPYGLQLMLHALPGAMHEGDPIALLNTDSTLQTLREEVMQPEFIPNLIKEWLLDNPHRVTLTLAPDATLAEKEAAEEQQKLAEIKARLTEAEQKQIIEQAVALQARQLEEDDPSILPEVTKADIPKEIKLLKGEKTQLHSLSLTHYEQGTNGIVYQQLIVELPELTQSQAETLPLFNSCLTELGSGERDYLQTQSLQAAVTGGLSASSSLHSHLTEAQDFYHYFVLSGKALNRNQQALSQLMQETFLQPRFDETQRIKELLAQIRSSVEHRITGNGHGLAMNAAVQNFTPVARWNFERNGFKGIQQVKGLDSVLTDMAQIEAISEQFQQIAKQLVVAPKQSLLIDDPAGMPQALKGLESAWQPIFDQPQQSTAFSLSASHTAVKQAWTTSTQVNFCAMAYPAVPAGHPDAPKLAVLGACLRNGYLHTAIREQGGAYGGGATYNSEASAFCFFSYRDPRLLETFEDFKQAKAWLFSDQAKQTHVDEAIMNVMSAMDKPGSPAGEARKAFYLDLYGRTTEHRKAYREGVLSATLEELRAVAERYFDDSKASYAVLTHTGTTTELAEIGFEILAI